MNHAAQACRGPRPYTCSAGRRRATELVLAVRDVVMSHTALLFVAAGRPANLATPLTRHFAYRSDKMSRLAPPSELSERHYPCRIRRLADCRALGAHFAEEIGVLPF